MYGERPLEAERHLLRTDAAVIRHPERNVTLLTLRPIHAGEDAHVAAAVRDVRVARVDSDGGILASGDREEIALADLTVIGAAGDRDGRIVLLRAVDAVRPLVVGGDVVELGGGLVVDARPRGAGIIRNGRAAVIAVDEATPVLRIDPHDVRVAVRTRTIENVLPPSTDRHT
jgi:hypothetical protein